MQGDLILTWQALILHQSSLEIWLHASIYICNITTPETNIILGNLVFLFAAWTRGKDSMFLLACHHSFCAWKHSVPECKKCMCQFCKCGSRACPWVYSPRAPSKSHTNVLKVAITCLGFSGICLLNITRTSCACGQKQNYRFPLLAVNGSY